MRPLAEETGEVWIPKLLKETERKAQRSVETTRVLAEVAKNPRNAAIKELL